MNRLYISLREGLVWRLIAVVAVPGIVWLVAGNRYEFRAERAGGVHYQARIDRRRDEACLIMRDADVTAGLQGYLCKLIIPK